MSCLPEEKVIAPIDFSGNSVGAVATALEFVENPSDIHAIHVVVPVRVLRRSDAE